MINWNRNYPSLVLKSNVFNFRFLSYRIKRRTTEEMEQDLDQEKNFDMKMQLKGISLLLPENGVVYK